MSSNLIIINKKSNNELAQNTIEQNPKCDQYHQIQTQKPISNGSLQWFTYTGNNCA